MSACKQQHWFHHISEPEQGDYGSRGVGREKYKQVARILKHLRDELHDHEPRLAQPTNSMISHLVFNCPPPIFDQGDWQEIITNALQFLQKASDNTSLYTQHFTHQDTDTPLFPNNELFDEHDVYLFCSALLTHLANELN